MPHFISAERVFRPNFFISEKIIRSAECKLRKSDLVTVTIESGVRDPRRRGHRQRHGSGPSGDVFSRNIVGWQVYDCESAQLASGVLQDICARQGIAAGQLVVHSDNGAPMKGETMLATMHAGQDKPLLKDRVAVYELARQANPIRWSKQTRDWSEPAG